MKLIKYIVISALLHLAVLSVFSFKRNVTVSLGIKGGEIALHLGSSVSGGGDVSSEGKSFQSDIADRIKTSKNGSGEKDKDNNGNGDGGLYGAVGKLVAEAYRNNPPEYPAIARAMGYQGRVTLLLEVMPDGRCGTVDITKSSGYRVLDLAALRAAKGWIFFTGNSFALASPLRVSQDVIFMLKTY